MAESIFSLIPVRVSDLAVDKPVPYAIYDIRGKLLLAAGRVIETAAQLDDLLDNGFRYDPKWDVELAPPKPPLPNKRVGGRSSVPRAVPVTPSPSVSASVPDSSPVPASSAESASVSAPHPLPSFPPSPAPQLVSAAGNHEDQNREVVVAMDEVRWTVGDALYLQQLDNPAVRHSVRLIGYVKGKTVLVTAPMADGKVFLIREGQSFVVRAFSGRKAYAFAAAAVRSAHSPHPYLHLSYPKEVRCTLVRRAARASVNIVAAISIGTKVQAAAATLTDLSLGGASALAKSALGAKGDEAEVKFRLNAAGEDEYLNLRAVVRSVAQDEQGWRHGLEFVDVPQYPRLILSAYVHRILAEGEP